MKVVITGHTKGIGKALADIFSKHNHEVVGFSRSNGFDISDKSTCDRILELSKDADVFINNAFHYQGQYDLLEGMINSWNDTNKLIINVNSKIKFIGEKGEQLFLSMLDEPKYFKAYIDSKRKQDVLTKSRLAVGKPHILDVSPGVVDTDMGKLFNTDKLEPSDVAELVYHVTSLRSKIAVRELVLDVPGLSWFEMLPKDLPN